MKDERDDTTEYIGGHMGTPPTHVYKGTKIPVNEKVDGFYEVGGPFCGSLTCFQDYPAPYQCRQAD